MKSVLTALTGLMRPCVFPVPELAREVEGLLPALRSAYPDLLADYVASVIKKGDERPVNRRTGHKRTASMCL